MTIKRATFIAIGVFALVMAASVLGATEVAAQAPETVPITVEVIVDGIDPDPAGTEFELWLAEGEEVGVARVGEPWTAQIPVDRSYRLEVPKRYGWQSTDLTCNGEVFDTVPNKRVSGVARTLPIQCYVVLSPSLVSLDLTQIAGVGFNPDPQARFGYDVEIEEPTPGSVFGTSKRTVRVALGMEETAELVVDGPGVIEFTAHLVTGPLDAADLVVNCDGEHVRQEYEFGTFDVNCELLIPLPHEVVTNFTFLGNDPDPDGTSVDFRVAGQQIVARDGSQSRTLLPATIDRATGQRQNKQFSVSGFDSDWGDFDFVCDTDDAVESGQRFWRTVKADRTTIQCDVTLYAPYDVIIDIIGEPPEAVPNQVIAEIGPLSQMTIEPGQPASFEGRTTNVSTLDLYDVPGRLVDRAVCDDGQTVFDADRERPWRLSLRSDRRGDLSCTVYFTIDPRAFVRIWSSTGLPAEPDGQMWLDIDGEGEFPWNFAPSTLILEPPFQTVVIQRVTPADRWYTTGIECSEGATADWVDLGDGRSQATIQATLGSAPDCRFQNVDRQNAPTEVTVTLDAPAGVSLPPTVLQWNVPNSIESGVLLQGQASTTTINPWNFDDAGFSLSPVPTGWLVNASCSTIVDQQRRTENTVTVELDLPPALGEPQTCNVTLDPAEAVTFAIARDELGAPVGGVRASLTGPLTSLPAGEVTNILATSGENQLYVRWGDRTYVRKISCSSPSAGTVEIDVPAQFGWGQGLDLPTIPPGETVSCVVTSESQPNTVVEVVHSALEAPNAEVPATFIVDSRMSIAAASTYETDSSRTWIQIVEMPNRRPVSISCVGAPWELDDVVATEIEVEVSEASFVRCTFVTEAADNPPAVVNFTPVFVGAQGALPPASAEVDGVVVPWPSTGLALETVLGWGDSAALSLEFPYLEPAGWKYSSVSCNDVPPGRVTHRAASNGFFGPTAAAVVVFLGYEREAGASLDCTVSFVPAPPPDRALRLVVEVDGEPSADVAVTFDVTAGASGTTVVATPTAEGVLDLPAGVNSARATPQPIAGFATAGGICYNASPTYFVDEFGWGSFSPRWDEVPDQLAGEDIICELRLIRTEVATLSLSNQTSNGLTVEVTTPGGDVEVRAIAPRQSLELPIASGEALVAYTLSAVTELQELVCNRPVAFSSGLGEFEIDVWPEEARSCTFIGRSLSPGTPGDADCGGATNSGDVRAIAEFLVQQRGLVARCDGATSAEIAAEAADIDGNGVVDLLDGLIIARCSAGYPDVRCPVVVSE